MSSRYRDIHYTDGNWSVRTYGDYLAQLCHTHDDGLTIIIPFGFSMNNGYRCNKCMAVAPKDAVMSWIFLNWDAQ